MQNKNQFFDDLSKNPSVRRIKSILDPNATSTNQINVKKIKPSASSPDVYIKRSDAPQAVASATSAIMYNQIGITTPPIHTASKEKTGKIITLQQDVHSIPSITPTLACNDVEYRKVSSQVWGKYKWQIFYDSDLIKTLLQFMTPECLNQLRNIFLVDELRSDTDRHFKNFFFYKKKDEEKYSGVMVIDLELMRVLNFGPSKDEFGTFVTTPYISITPQQTEDYLSYYQRINDIRELLQDGVLLPNNIEILTNALKHDMSKDARAICRQLHLNAKQKNNIITPLSRIHQYRLETLGKDLGL